MKLQQNGFSQGEKLVFEYTPRPKRCSNSQQVRTRYYDHIVELAEKCNMPIAQVIDRLLAYALEHVELVERPVYDMALFEATVANANEETSEG